MELEELGPSGMYARGCRDQGDPGPTLVTNYHSGLELEVPADRPKLSPVEAYRGGF